MRSIIIVAAASAAVVAGCTVKTTTVERPAPAPVVYAQPAPPVIYQAPAPTVVYQAPPVVRQPIEQPPPRTVSVTYKGGLDGFELAVQKANRWCGDNFGNSAARMVADDRATGHARFTCIEL